MFSLFAMAGQGVNLTPGQRAFLKLVQGAIIAGLVAALPAIAQGAMALAGDLGQQGFQWAPSLLMLLVGAAHAAAGATTKYWTAHADAPLLTQAPAPAVQAIVSGYVNTAAPMASAVQVLPDATPASFGSYPSSYPAFTVSTPGDAPAPTPQAPAPEPAPVEAPAA